VAELMYGHQFEKAAGAFSTIVTLWQSSSHQPAINLWK